MHMHLQILILVAILFVYVVSKKIINLEGFYLSFYMNKSFFVYLNNKLRNRLLFKSNTNKSSFFCFFIEVIECLKIISYSKYNEL